MIFERTTLARALLLTGLMATGGAAVAAPNFPDRYIDPDDLLEEEPAGADAAWPGGLDSFAAYPQEVFDTEGIVEAVSFDGPTILLDGLIYGFSLVPDIRLRSGAGAPTLLAPGMVLEVYFTEDDAPAGTSGRIIAAIELDPGLAEPE